MKIEVIKADITALNVDAIVNAANRWHSPGGGVCGAIHDQAGPQLTKRCAAIRYWSGGLLPGEAIITGGYNLPARHIIHTLGPVWRKGTAKEEAWLHGEMADCYRNSLLLAEKHQLQSIAFPAIGTGAFGWDREAAAQIAVPTILNHPAQHIQHVVLCCYSTASVRITAQCLRSHRSIAMQSSMKTHLKTGPAG